MEDKIIGGERVTVLGRYSVGRIVNLCIKITKIYISNSVRENCMHLGLILRNDGE